MSSCFNGAINQNHRLPQSVQQQSAMGSWPAAPHGFGQRPSGGAVGALNSSCAPHQLPLQVNNKFYSCGPTSTASSSCGATPSPPPIINSLPIYTFDSTQQSPPIANAGNILSGIGTVLWLNAERGLIEIIPLNTDGGEDNVQKVPSDGSNTDKGKSAFARSSPTNFQVAFGIKELCDQAVGDLTSVLRVGFLLKYHAVATAPAFGGICSQQPRHVANFVSPIPLVEWDRASSTVQAAVQKLCVQLDKPTTEPLPVDDGSRRKQVYDLDSELKATNLLMNIYREQVSDGPQCPLSTFHCIVSNCRDDNMYRYIGTSSQKRRQFIERRRHFFAFAPDDTVCLVPAAVHTAVSALARELLQRGGAMKLQELFNQYLNWPDLPLEAREIVGETKLNFVNFLENHPFVFVIFPSRVFVSLRRRLPDFDYGTFLEDCFGDREGSPLFVQCHTNVPGASGGFGQGTTQPQPSPGMMAPYWGQSGEDQRNTQFGVSQGGVNNRTQVSPLMFPQPTPPGYPQSALPRFGPPHNNNNYNNFNMAPPAPPPFPGPRGTAPVFNAGQWPCRNPDEVTLPGSVGGSSHSLSSGYSTGPTPSTPGINHTFPFWPLGGNAMSQNSAGASTATTENVAGFWKSYELGTESLIRQLHLSNNAHTGQQHNATESRTNTPNNMPNMRPLSSTVGKTSESAAQTERITMTMKCGHCGGENEWQLPTQATAGMVEKVKPDTMDTAVQTDASSAD